MRRSGLDPARFRPAAAIRVHALFARARAAYIDATIALYENQTFLTRLLIEVGRSVVFFNLLTLDAAFQPEDRATWPTIGLLQKVVAAYGVTSERRVHDLVHRLLQTGYVLSRPAQGDRRVRLLRPSEKMLQHHRDWLRSYHVPLELMFPESGYAPAMRGDLAFQSANLAVARGLHGYSAHLMAENPIMLFFMTREAGAIILIKLFQLAKLDNHPAGPSVSFTDLGQRFGVSRTHVRLLLKDAEDQGYLRATDDRIALLPPVVAAFDQFLADCMAGHDLMFQITVRRIAASSAQPTD